LKILVEHIAGALAGKNVEIDRPMIRFGRAPDNDVPFHLTQDINSSAHHAELRAEQGQVFLHDLNSTNGLFLNGRRVQRATIANGDVVEFGANGPKVRLILLDRPSLPPTVDVPSSGVAPPGALPPGSPPPLGAPPALARPPGAPIPFGAPPVLGGPGQGPGAPQWAPPAPPPGAPQWAPPAPPPGAPPWAPRGAPPGPPRAAPPPTAAPPPGMAPPPPAAPPMQQVVGGPVSPAGLAPGQKVGARTVAMMIDQALLQARSRDKGGAVGKGTVFVRSMVDQAVKSSTRKFRVLLVLSLVVLLGGGGFAAYMIWERSGMQDSERDRLVKEIAALAREQERKVAAKEKAAVERERQDTQRRIAELTKKLGNMQGAGSGADIVTRNRQTVYLLVAQYGAQESAFCTGFAVRANLLATNAHCVHGARPLIQKGATIVAVLNGSGRSRYRVTQMVAHPGYKQGVAGNDVGLMRVEGSLSKTVRLASVQELRAVAQGQTMYTLGFPGSLAKPSSPEATITQGIISRMMTPAQNPGSFDAAHVLQHTAYVTGGTSGSPIFDTAGTVIGINAGGLKTKQDVFLGGDKTRPVSMVFAAPGYNFGMRIDLLDDILGQI
jgi:V8-like Glu-specific endopeptidase